VEIKSKVIGSHTYHVRQLGSKEARSLLVRLTSVLGPVLGAAIPQGASMADIMKLQVQFGSGLAELANKLKEEDLEYACRVLGAATEVDLGGGKQVPLTLERQELHFCGGRLSEMFRWLQFALEVQYSDFFTGLVRAPSA
jgi:hypothetical protein